MKLYVHDESTQTAKVLQWEWSGDSKSSTWSQQFNSLKSRIGEVFNLKGQGKTLVELRNDNNKPISCLKDKMDIFITTTSGKSVVDSSNVATSSNSESSKSQTNQSKTPSPKLEQDSALTGDLQELANKAVQYFQSRNYKVCKM